MSVLLGLLVVLSATTETIITETAVPENAVTKNAVTKCRVTMSLDNAVVHRPVKAAERNLLIDLPEGVAVTDRLPENLSGLAKTLRKTLAKTACAEPGTFRQDAALFILAVGPILDGPDKVLPRSMIHGKDLLELEIVHTAARLQEVPLRRNIRWRPVVQVPVKLPPGRFRIRVTWRAVVELPDGKALKAPPKIHSAEIMVLPRQQAE